MCGMINTIGGRPVDVTKTDDGLKIVFHPVAKGAKHPEAKVFQLVLSERDLDALGKEIK